MSLLCEFFASFKYFLEDLGSIRLETEKPFGLLLSTPVLYFTGGAARSPELQILINNKLRWRLRIQDKQMKLKQTPHRKVAANPQRAMSFPLFRLWRCIPARSSGSSNLQHIPPPTTTTHLAQNSHSRFMTVFLLTQVRSKHLGTSWLSRFPPADICLRRRKQETRREVTAVTTTSKPDGWPSATA